MARPAVAQDRLALLSTGRVRVEVKHPWRDGTTHLDFEPLDFIGRLAAFVPRPRTNLILYHGVLAPSARLRAAVVRYGRDVSGASNAARKQERPLRRRHGERWAWANLMRRTFELDVLECPHCGGRLRLLATIADRRTARAILEQIGDRQTPRAPPAASPAATLN